MRCFNKKAAHKQQLVEEVKWLQQMLAKEQHSKQTVLGQLQDEKAKCAMLELEILHAAQAAQEMGESLCLFFNPCYQQSEQQVLQLGQPQGQPSADDDIILTPDSDITAAAAAAVAAAGHQQGPQEAIKQQEETSQQPPAGSTDVDQTFPLPPLQQQQQQDPSSDLPSDDLPSDPDTAAHDQTPIKPAREPQGLPLCTSIEQWLPTSEPRLCSPCRSLKLSPGRRSSPRRLARNSMTRSLGLSSSSPMKQPAAAAAAATTAAEESSSILDQLLAPGTNADVCRSPAAHPPAAEAAAAGLSAPHSPAAAAASSSAAVRAGIQQAGAIGAATHGQQGSPAAAETPAPSSLPSSTKLAPDGPCTATAAVAAPSAAAAAKRPMCAPATASQQPPQCAQQATATGTATVANAALAAALSGNHAGGHAAAATAAALHQPQAAAAAAGAAQYSIASSTSRWGGGSGRSAFSAAAAAAAAIQQSVSAASASIAAAEAARGQSRAQQLAAPHSHPPPSILAPTAPPLGSAVGTATATNSSLGCQEFPCAGRRAGTAAAVSDCNSSSSGSSDSAWGQPECHKLPASIISASLGQQAVDVSATSAVEVEAAAAASSSAVSMRNLPVGQPAMESAPGVEVVEQSKDAVMASSVVGIEAAAAAARSSPSTDAVTGNSTVVLEGAAGSASSSPGSSSSWLQKQEELLLLLQLSRGTSPASSRDEDAVAGAAAAAATTAAAADIAQAAQQQPIQPQQQQQQQKGDHCVTSPRARTAKLTNSSSSSASGGSRHSAAESGSAGDNKHTASSSSTSSSSRPDTAAGSAAELGPRGLVQQQAAAAADATFQSHPEQQRQEKQEPAAGVADGMTAPRITSPAQPSTDAAAAAAPAGAATAATAPSACNSDADTTGTAHRTALPAVEANRKLDRRATSTHSQCVADLSPAPGDSLPAALAADTAATAVAAEVVSAAEAAGTTPANLPAGSVGEGSAAPASDAGTVSNPVTAVQGTTARLLPPVPLVAPGLCAAHATGKAVSSSSRLQHSRSYDEPAVEYQQLPPQPLLQQQQEQQGLKRPYHQQVQQEQYRHAGSTSHPNAAVSRAPAPASVGPMHAAAFGPGLALAADTNSSTDIYARLPPVSKSYRSSRTAQQGASLQQQQYRLRPLQAYNAYSRDVDSARQPLVPKPQILRATAAYPAAMHRQDLSTAAVTGGTAATAAAGGLAAAAAAAAEADLRMLAVSRAAAAVLVEPTSCLSPLHWHQSNLGSSRDEFHQAMMLAACSNPSSVMRQQQAFDQLDTRSVSRAAKRQLRRGGPAGFTADAAGTRKPRKGWMALF